MDTYLIVLLAIITAPLWGIGIIYLVGLGALLLIKIIDFWCDFIRTITGRR